MTKNAIAFTVVIDPDESDKQLVPYSNANVEIDVGEHR